ncbi:MAG: hypothetical protein QNJ81_09800 [Acidimicrobiia bacterium]|nr:hypothetical protein [Acidimicrobiia bacterium]
MDKVTAAPETTTTNQPSSVVGSAPRSGAAASQVRATARQRAIIKPIPWDWDGGCTGYTPTHPYVRLYWTATIGPGAVADLLRLATAATRGRSLRRPTHLHVLVRVGLAHTHKGHVFVRTTIPELNAIQVRLLPPDLRRQHPETNTKM